MRTERRRETRYPFIAMAEIVDEKENARTSSRISDLSLHGCYVEMTNPFSAGTTVMIEIYTETESVEAQATVAFFEAHTGMGLMFREMPEHYTNVLKKWWAEATARAATTAATAAARRTYRGGAGLVSGLGWRRNLYCGDGFVQCCAGA